MYNYPNYRNMYQQNYGTTNMQRQDDRFLAGGFLAPFLLGGITGGLLAPAFGGGYSNRPCCPNYYYPQPYPQPYPVPYPYYGSYRK